MDLAKELTKQKLNNCTNEVRSLKQRLSLIEKEKTQILNRIRLLENNIKQTNIDRNFIVDYCKIKKFVQ
jgi:hypothetical protein